MAFKYDGGGLAKGSNVTLYYDGQNVGEGRVERSVPMCFSADETTDVVYETGTAVTPDYNRHATRFSGKIHWVRSTSAKMIKIILSRLKIGYLRL
jgi:arylsulfatase